MFALTNKPEMAARLYASIIKLASDPVRGTDLMKVMQHMAGVLVETCLVFEHPDQSLQGSFQKLARLLNAEMYDTAIVSGSLPPAHVIDFETERGREVAREYFEEWLDCEFEFHSLLLVVIHNMIVSWEQEGINRGESFRVLVECAQRCLAFEIAAQELCDIMIEDKIGKAGWHLGECVAALSAVAGRRLALSLNSDSCSIFRGCDLPENLDRVVYVMTQEAVRLGVPPGSDWRFGLAANDMPANAPYELIKAVEPYCVSFFRAIKLHSLYDQSVSCAKAAGRMLAVAAGGEAPGIEPAIAKPLAMAAITETYKSVCMDYTAISV
jgi:hypothetical protein